MKNLSLILNGILAIAVAVLYYLHFSATPSSLSVNEVVADSLSSTLEDYDSDSLLASLPDSLPAGDKIAFVNFDVLTEKYQFYKDGVKLLEQEFKKKQDELMQRQKKLEEDVMRYQQLAPNMGADARAAKEEQLMADEKKLYEFRDDLEGSLAGKEEKFNREFLTKIDSYFKTLGKEKNYDYVFVYSKGGPSYIVYANEELNITKLTLQGLNSQYKK